MNMIKLRPHPRPTNIHIHIQSLINLLVNTLKAMSYHKLWYSPRDQRIIISLVKKVSGVSLVVRALII